MAVASSFKLPSTHTPLADCQRILSENRLNISREDFSMDERLYLVTLIEFKSSGASAVV
jgi:hypothetical protein